MERDIRDVTIADKEFYLRDLNVTEIEIILNKTKEECRHFEEENHKQASLSESKPSEEEHHDHSEEESQQEPSPSESEPSEDHRHDHSEVDNPSRTFSF